MHSRELSPGGIGAVRVELSETARNYTQMRFNRPAWATGTISRTDAVFLFEMLVKERPRRVAEVGVASGVSSAFLSTLLADRLPDSHLYCYDKLEHLYSDPTKPVGAYLYELFDPLPANLTLVPGVGCNEIRASGQRPESFDFVFLDACHRHPWPCNDLLSLLDVVEPCSWVALHDVFLPFLQKDFQLFGPLYLYQLWPGEKCAPIAEDANIAAIRLFERPKDTAAALIECCKIPWRDQMERAEWETALEAVAGLSGRLHHDLQAIANRPAMNGNLDLRHCEVVVRGVNPWSRFAADPTAERIVLHANRLGEPPISITIRGLDAAKFHAIVFPGISRSKDSDLPLVVRWTLRDASGSVRNEQLLQLADADSHFRIIDNPVQSGSIEIEFAVLPVGERGKLNGAWVKFDAVHFI